MLTFQGLAHMAAMGFGASCCAQSGLGTGEFDDSFGESRIGVGGGVVGVAPESSRQQERSEQNGHTGERGDSEDQLIGSNAIAMASGSRIALRIGVTRYTMRPTRSGPVAAMA